MSSINAATGNVELESTGTITDVGGTETTTDITAAGVTIRNATGVGVDAGNSLNLDADTLTITTLSGNAFITEANGIGLGTVNVVGNALTLEAITGNITDSTSAVAAGNLSLTATASNASIGATGAANDINVSVVRDFDGECVDRCGRYLHYRDRQHVGVEHQCGDG